MNNRISTKDTENNNGLFVNSIAKESLSTLSASIKHDFDSVINDLKVETEGSTKKIVKEKALVYLSIYLNFTRKSRLKDAENLGLSFTNPELLNVLKKNAEVAINYFYSEYIGKKNHATKFQIIKSLPIKSGDVVYVPSKYKDDIILKVYLINNGCHVVTDLEKDKQYAFDWILLTSEEYEEDGVTYHSPAEVYDYNMFIQNNLSENGKLLLMAQTALLTDSKFISDIKNSHSLCSVITTSDLMGVFGEYSYTSFLLFSKNRNSSIKFFNGAEINWGETDNFYNSLSNNDPKLNKEVDYTDLLGNLLPSIYLYKADCDKLYSLNDLVEFLPKELSEAETDYLYYGFSTDYNNCVCTSKDCLTRMKDKGFQISNNCIVAHFKDDSIYLTKVENPVLSNVYVQYNNVAFRLKRTDLLSEEYLLKSLNTEYIKKQILSAYTICKEFDKEFGENKTAIDFKDLVIEIPNKEDQQRQLKEDAVKLAERKEKLFETNYTSYKEDIKMKQKSLESTIADIENCFNLLISSRKDGVLYEEAAACSDSSLTVKDLYSILRGNLSVLSTQLHNFTYGEDLKKDTIYLDKFISDYKEKHEDLRVTFELGNIKATGIACMFSRSISFPKKGLTDIFDYIVSNAKIHGLADKIHISVSYGEIKKDDKTSNVYHCITISNNGKPIEKTIDIDKLGTYGYTSQKGKMAGQSIYFIKMLLDRYSHGSFLKIESDEHNQYPVAYHIYFSAGLVQYSEAHSLSELKKNSKS